MRTAMIVAGALIELVGWLWVGQGSGLVRWPASSFMIDQRMWLFAGAALVLVGFALLMLGLRRRA